jgi:hypothetical protein
MSMIETLKGMAARVIRRGEPVERLANEPPKNSSEKGLRPTPENSWRYLNQLMWVDPEVRQSIVDIRDMDKRDGRVKNIHNRVARDTVRGGLVMTMTRESPSIRREWDGYVRRLQLNRIEKLKSDARGLVMEGNLPLQWVLDERLQVAAAVRMPSETIRPEVGKNGLWKDVRQAYSQINMISGVVETTFPLWQLHLARMDPDNFDDLGAMGRPFLDAGRSVWRKLDMTEEDLVIRRRTRAPLRLAHVLEGATKDELDDYQNRTEGEKGEITTDFYMNRKGGVQAVQGDASLSDIDDVVHLMSTFFAGGPLPGAMLGYTSNVARDILEDLRRTYFEQIDELQDMQAYAYDAGFRLHLLLQGVVPDPESYLIGFAQRRTETANQTTDRVLKWQAMGIPPDMLYEELGFSAAYVRARAAEQSKRTDPYPGDPAGTAPPGTVPKISITPGNAPKGESATSTTHSNRLGEHWGDET